MEAIKMILDKTITPTQTMSSCEVCDMPTEAIIDFGEVIGKKYVTVACKCQQDEYQQNKLKLENIEKQRRLEKLYKNSLMDKRFRECTFENFDKSKVDEKYYNLGINYCNDFKKACDENIGLLIHGNCGTGKTFLSSCIANKLLSEYTPVMAVSATSILGRIRETFNRYGELGEADIIRSLKQAQLLIIDDLGAEQRTQWSTSKLYEIIDNRYRDGKPLIITTNLSLLDLRKHLQIDESNRIYDRLVEMCTPVKFVSENKRIQSAISKQKFVSNLYMDEHQDD